MTGHERAAIKKYSSLIQSPVYDIGSYKTNEEYPDHREAFKGKQYIGVDVRTGPGVDLVWDITKQPLPSEAGGIICASMLEHCTDPWAAAENISFSLKTGGILIIGAPFSWRFHGHPNDYWRFTTEGIKLLFPDIGWTRLKYTTCVKEKSFSTFGKLSNTMPSPEKGFIPRSNVLGIGVKK